MDKNYKGPFRRDKKKEEKKEEPIVNNEAKDDMRLNRYLAHAGVASRRKCDEIIKEGRVTVNGVVVKEMGHRVLPEDEIALDGRVVKPITNFIYLLLNKPHNVITTVNDEKDRKTVLDIALEYTKERVYPVGRLDRNTTGLIVLTNDGDFAQKLSHPKYELTKVYYATLDKVISQAELDQIQNTLILEDGPAPVDAVAHVEGKKNNVVGIELNIGRNRIVRRIFEHLGYEVKKLDRTRYGMLTKKNLPVGKCRHLTKAEVNILKHLTKPGKES